MLNGSMHYLKLYLSFGKFTSQALQHYNLPTLAKTITMRTLANETLLRNIQIPDLLEEQHVIGELSYIDRYTELTRQYP